MQQSFLDYERPSQALSVTPPHNYLRKRGGELPVSAPQDSARPQHRERLGSGCLVGRC